jgi:hypothetical protein
MSNDGRKKIELWDGIIEYEEPASNAGAETIKASIDEGLRAFERHKKELLDVLSNAYERGLKCEPFDADYTWRKLTSVASYYIYKELIKQKTMNPPDRQAKLRDLAKTLKRASDTIRETLQSDVGNDLISAWWDADATRASVPFGNDGQSDFVDLQFFEKTGALLAALEAVALRAADEVVPKRGRPKGTAILPLDFIVTLAGIYRESTQSKAGAGEGPFARLCVAFLTALGRRIITDESVFEAIKDARVWAQSSRWPSGSPFDD